MKQRIPGYFQLLSKTKPQNISSTEWIKLTKLMKKCDYEMNTFELRQYSINVSKVIAKCKNDIQQIQAIYSLIKDCYDNDKYIKTALINAFGINGKTHIQTCVDIFNSIDNNDIDAFIIDAMMKVYITHDQHDKALRIYDRYKDLADDGTHVLAIKVCTALNNFERGKQIHDNIRKNDNNIFIQTALIDFYGKFSKIDIALNEFNAIPKKNKISLNAMLTAFVNNERYNDAVNLYQEYQTLHDDISHIMAIKACSNNVNYDYGVKIHSNIEQQNKLNNIELYNTLMDFYGKFGKIGSAMDIFSKLQQTKLATTVSVNCIMNILLNDKNINECDKALDIYHHHTELQDDLSHTLAMKACINLRDSQRGESIIDAALNSNYSISLRFKNIMIDFYGSFGKICQARNVFDSVSFDNKSLGYVVTINSMMTAYINNEMHDDGWKLYENAWIKDDISHTLALKICIQCHYFDRANSIVQILKNRKDLSNELKNTLIDYYGRIGNIKDAQIYFNGIDDKYKTDITINTMMKSYCFNQHYDLALKIYDKYVLLHDDISHIEAIKACIGADKYDKGNTIAHNVGILEDDRNSHLSIKLRNIFIEFYGQYGEIQTALTIFNSIDDKDKTSNTINSMIQCLMKNEKSVESLEIYDKYQDLHNEVSHLLAIKGCIYAENYEKGIEIEHVILNSNTAHHKSALIDFYSHFNMIDKAMNVFKSIDKDYLSPVNVNSMITGYANNEYYKEGISLYNEYYDKCQCDDVSHMLAIKLCTKIQDYESGLQICQNIGLEHDIDENADILKNMMQSLKVTLIDFFGNKQDIEMCKTLFNSISNDNKDIITICVMMEAYYDCNMYHKAIQLFQDIDKINKDINLNNIAYCILFKACTNGTMFHVGNEVYQSMKANNDSNLRDLSVQNNLINMYGKCGMINICQEIMDDIKLNEPSKYISEITIWNVMIKAYGRNGETDKVKEIWTLLKDTIKDKSEIGVATYNNLIHAFSHCGQPKEAKKIWYTEIVDDEIKYYHFIIAGLVDCYSRNGMLKEAEILINEYEKYTKNNNNKIIKDETRITTYKSMWMSVLFGCRKYIDKEYGNHIYNEIKKRGFEDDIKYSASIATMLANIHAATEQDDDKLVIV